MSDQYGGQNQINYNNQVQGPYFNQGQSTYGGQVQGYYGGQPQGTYGGQPQGSFGGQPQFGDPYQGNFRGAFSPGPVQGFSMRIDDDDVQEALKKHKRSVVIAWIVVILLPLIGFTIFGAVSDKVKLGQGVAYGVIISLILFIACFISAIAHKLTKPFEGVVADKRTWRTYRSRGRSRTRRMVWIDCDDGKRRKKEVHAAMYEALQVGERVRYLPQFPQPFEKYVKSDGMVMCMFCGHQENISQDTCSVCHSPLIK